MSFPYRVASGVVKGLRGFPAWPLGAAALGMLGKGAMWAYFLFSADSGFFEAALEDKGVTPEDARAVVLTWLWTAGGLLWWAIILRRAHGGWNGPKTEASA